MADIAPTYDLMLLLDPKADDATRAKIREDARAMISANGTLGETQEYGAGRSPSRSATTRRPTTTSSSSRARASCSSSFSAH